MTALVAGSLLLLPALASAHTCGDVWCSGSDTSTANTTQGNNPQIYIGEIGEYNHDFEGQAGPCPSSPQDACWSSGGANGADNLRDNGNGIGVEFYYLGGGAGASAAGDYGSAYCWGWHEGVAATNDISQSRSGELHGDQIIFLDIEGNSHNGWFNTTPDKNRSVFNGFRDYVQGDHSQDSGHCPNDNDGRTYQHAVYSAPSQWQYSFDASSSDLSRTPEWTYDDCCNDTWPDDFNHSSSDQAHWFGSASNNDWRDGWQFNQTPDHDIFQEPIDLPWFGHSLGN